MKLLDTAGGNTKIRKSMKDKPKKRIGSLSMYPDDILCPARHIAGCAKMCLEGAGRGVMKPVKDGRFRKTMYYHNDTQGFLEQLRRELFNFNKLCKRTGVEPIARLNTLSDVRWERHEIPQEFPDIFFYDYTKNPSRLGKTPANYDLMYSYSAEPEYQKYVKKALKTVAPMSVVFRNGMPEFYLGRRVIDGDASDLVNVKAGAVIVGLKAKGKAKKDKGNFVVDASNLIAVAA